MKKIIRFTLTLIICFYVFALKANTNGIGFSDVNIIDYTLDIKAEARLNLTGTVTCVIVAYQDVTCNGGNDGAINVEGMGGTGPYMFDLGGGASPINDFTNLAAGAYIVTVTDANACTSTCSQVVLEPSPLSCSTIGSNVTCNDFFDGSITVFVAGGTGPYLYSIDGVSYQASNVFTGLPAGTYTTIVLDANACETTCLVGITEPSPLSCSALSTPETCAGTSDGSIEIDAIGGVGSYAYDIGFGSNTTGFFDALVPDIYSVTVTDANACTTICTAVVEGNSPLTCTIDYITDVTCESANDGSLGVSTQGGVAPYFYDIGFGVNATGSFNDLAAGVYTVTIVDANGCSVECTTGTIIEPSPLSCSTIGSNVTCNDSFDGSIIVTAAGGTGPYLYSIDGVSYQASNVFTGLPAGTYTTIVLDANACETTCLVGITEPIPLSCSALSTPETCAGTSDGSIEIDAIGGVGSYAYDIGFGSNTTGFFDALVPDIYSVTVTDANACTTICTAVVESAITIQLSCGNTPILCNGDMDGTAYVDVQNPNGNYNYEWQNSGGMTVGSDFVIGGLVEDIYLVIVTDMNGCSAACTVDIAPIIECCPTAYTIPGYELGLAGYETNGTITCEQVILAGADVDLDAGLEIDLLPGFEVELGAEFDAFIDGCGN